MSRLSDHQRFSTSPVTEQAFRTDQVPDSPVSEGFPVTLILGNVWEIKSLSHSNSSSSKIFLDITSDIPNIETSTHQIRSPTSPINTITMSDFPKPNALFNPNAYRSQAAYATHQKAAREVDIIDNAPPTYGNSLNTSGNRNQCRVNNAGSHGESPKGNDGPKFDRHSYRAPARNVTNHHHKSKASFNTNGSRTHVAHNVNKIPSPSSNNPRQTGNSLKPMNSFKPRNTPEHGITKPVDNTKGNNTFAPKIDNTTEPIDAPKTATKPNNKTEPIDTRKPVDNRKPRDAQKRVNAPFNPNAPMFRPNGYGKQATSNTSNNTPGEAKFVPRLKQIHRPQKNHKQGTSSNNNKATKGKADEFHHPTDKELDEYVRNFYAELNADYERDKKAGKLDDYVPAAGRAPDFSAFRKEFGGEKAKVAGGELCNSMHNPKKPSGSAGAKPQGAN